MTYEQPKNTAVMEKLLRSNNHMAGIERLEMIVEEIHYPFAHVARVVGTINPSEPDLWAKPNIALRLEVGGEEMGGRPLTRVYTIRHFDMKLQRMELDFVIHEGDAPAMHWLDGAKKGTSIFLIGPRQHYVPDSVLDKKIAFFADDTAIPALYAIFSQWSQNTKADIYIDCADAAYAAELPQMEVLSYHIHVRNEHEMAGKSDYLPAQAKTILDGQNWQIWVACEREEARQIRQHFMDHGCDKEHIKAVGYWKHGLSASQMDYARLAYYAKLHEAGKNLQQFDEFDVPA